MHFVENQRILYPTSRAQGTKELPGQAPSGQILSGFNRKKAPKNFSGRLRQTIFSVYRQFLLR